MFFVMTSGTPQTGLRPRMYSQAEEPDIKNQKLISIGTAELEIYNMYTCECSNI